MDVFVTSDDSVHYIIRKEHEKTNKVTFTIDGKKGGQLEKIHEQ